MPRVAFSITIVLLGVSLPLAACSKNTSLQTSPGQLAVLNGSADVTGKGDDFGQSCQGYPVTQTLTLFNSGGAEVNVQNAQATGAFALSGIPALPFAVSPSASVPLTVTFNPSGAGPVAGTLSVTSDADNPSLTVDLSGTVSSAPGQPTLGTSCSFQGTPHQPCTFLNFSGVAIGSSATQTVTITNTGCPPLTLQGAIVQDGGAYSLGTVPASVLLGQSAELSVTFTPPASGIAQGDLILTSNAPQGGPGQDAGEFVLSLTGVGSAAALILSPPSEAFGEVAPGTTLGQTFTVSNGGSASVPLAAPSVVETDDAGAFRLDAGWSQGFVLDAGSSVSCVVTVDLPGSGAYGATLSVPYGLPPGFSGQLNAQLTADAEGSLCVTPTSLDLGDAGEYCGAVTGTVSLATCTASGVPVSISSIAIDPTTNGAGLLNLVLPTGGPPWTVTPGGTPLQVSVTFQDDGQRTDYSSQLIVASDAAGQAQLLVPVVPEPVPVPPALGIPVFVDGGFAVGVPALFQVQPDDSANFAYQFYWLGKGDGGAALDAGLDVLPSVSGADVAFIPAAVGTYKVCVDEVEIDAGFGSCGFDAGNGTGQTGSHCSAAITVGP